MSLIKILKALKDYKINAKNSMAKGNKKILADGFKFNLPRKGAPDWVKGGISVKVEEAMAFIRKYKNSKGWLNLDLLKSKKGNLYLALNTYGRDDIKKDNTSKTSEKRETADDLDL